MPLAPAPRPGLGRPRRPAGTAARRWARRPGHYIDSESLSLESVGVRSQA